MAARTYRQPTPFEQTPPARRASGLALALALNLLLILALIGIGAFDPKRQRGGSPLRTIVVDLADDADRANPPERQRERRAEQITPPPPSERHPPPPPPIVVPQAPKIPPAKPLEMIELSRADYQRADIARMPKAPAGGGARSADSKQAGRGPNGEVLYAAEWAREPSDAELGGYLPASAPDGYGIVACKTVPQNRVEDCIELESGPRGSRLASAVRQAAWQFRVRPPRKNGKLMVGAWVVIRIDYVRERGR